MKKCTMNEIFDLVDASNDTVNLYTNNKGLRQMSQGNSFYVWTEKYANEDDTSLLVFLKDLAEDSNGVAYCVDGLDVQKL